jgi:hypothetical protein
MAGQLTSILSTERGKVVLFESRVGTHVHRLKTWFSNWSKVEIFFLVIIMKRHPIRIDGGVN